MINKQITGFESADEISRRISEIDRLIALQLDAILHHPEFKALEAAWRGAFYLVNRIEESLKVKVRIFHARKKDLLSDFERKLDLEETVLYQKVFSEVYSGIQIFPFGLLIGAYEFEPLSQDIFLIEKIAEIAALAHAPFIAGVSPSMFDWQSFEDAEQATKVALGLKPAASNRWNNFRKTENARYIGLCLPHVLLRELHEIDRNFAYRESAERSDLLWGNAAFSFAGCVARAYDEKSWLGEMSNRYSDGVIEGLPVWTDEQERRFSLDVGLEIHLPAISDFGFMSLVDDANGCPYFLDTQSARDPLTYDTDSARRTASQQAKVEHTLAMSRFAINMMCFSRDKFGRAESIIELKKTLNDWLRQYLHDSDHDSDEIEAERPLRSFYLDISEIPGKSNFYEGILYIRPTYLLDNLKAAMRTVINFPASS